MTEEVPEPASPGSPTEAAQVDEESASRTFFTGIDAEAGKKKGSKDKNRFRNLESTDSGNKIIQHFQDLTKLANSLDLRMEALLREHEQDFFLAYKTHMYTVQKEIKLLRMKALRLDELCKGYKKEVDKWKAKAEALDEDRRFLEDQIKGAKRQNKILRAAAERARSSAYTALMATKAKSEGEIEPISMSPPLGEAANRPGLDRSDGTAPMGVAGNRAMLSGRSVLGNEAERRYVEAIQSLKEGIEKEQYTVRMLQAARATAYSHKSEMEEFFLKCIDEARRELMRKKHITVNWQKSDREKVLEAMLNNEDILVCLYEKLFPHRTGIARSLGATNEGAQTMDF